MIKDTVKNGLLELFSSRMSRQANAIELMPKYRLGKNASLQKAEIIEIDRIWKPLSTKINYKYWELYKGVFAFSPMLMPDDIYVRRILRVLNPIRQCYCLHNKNMYPILYKELRMPVTLINCINGNAFDEDNKFIEGDSILKTLKERSCEDQLILKPSDGSCSGEGVSLLDLNDEGKCMKLISRIGSNYVIQKMQLQSEKTKRFNPSSLNTFRINTLNLNGRITVENILFRHGRGETIVDNAGSGGTCVGFDPNGKMIGKAIDACLNEYEYTAFGVTYKSLEFPELQNLCDFALWAHQRYLPIIGHAAWDLALDENDDPVFIEINLGWPGIIMEQLSSCKPIYGDRTYEVIEYVKSIQRKISFTDFMGHWT